LRAVASEPIDLLLSDVVMPGMSGPELARQVRAAQPGVRVLHMSGHASGLRGPHSNGDAIAQLLQKPFTSTELLARVRTLLGELELAARPS
jgi:two-component system, cell cycle sensor histidine kinase and response regulator CckA